MPKKRTEVSWTTVKEGKEFLKLGLDTNTADMYWSAISRHEGEAQDNAKLDWKLKASPYKDRFSVENGSVRVLHVPCWSVGKLMNLVPCACSLESFVGVDGTLRYCCFAEGMYESAQYKTPVEALCAVLKDCLRNNH